MFGQARRRARHEHGHTHRDSQVRPEEGFGKLKSLVGGGGRPPEVELPSGRFADVGVANGADITVVLSNHLQARSHRHSLVSTTTILEVKAGARVSCPMHQSQFPKDAWDDLLEADEQT